MNDAFFVDVVHLDAHGCEIGRVRMDVSSYLTTRAVTSADELAAWVRRRIGCNLPGNDVAVEIDVSALNTYLNRTWR